MNKPFETYNGGKGSDGTFQKIINRIPPHDIYIEAFVGNGTILEKKKLAQYSIAIDKDTAVIEAWKQNNNLPGVHFINADAISWLEHFRVAASIFKKMGIRVFIYLDPPYPKSIRKNAKNLYRHEMGDFHHTQLLNVARCYPANIAISSYPNKMYDNALAGWNSITFQSQTRAGTATEKLWFNYDTPVELHDYSYLGENYRERERIKGIIDRNTAKLKRMPEAERNAFIENLIKEGII